MKRFNILHVIVFALIFSISFSKSYAVPQNYIAAQEEVYYAYDGNILKIPAYKVDNELSICVEDLKYYGYEMKWNSKKRTSIFTKKEITSENMYSGTTQNNIPNEGIIYKSNVKIYVDSKLIPSYNINGYSLVKIKDFNAITKQIRLLKYKPMDKNNPEDLYLVGFSAIEKMGFINKDFDYVIKAEYSPCSTQSEYTGGDILSSFPIPVSSADISNYLEEEEIYGEKHLKLPPIYKENHNLKDTTINKFNYISQFKDGIAKVQIGGTDVIPHCPAGGSSLIRHKDIKNQATTDGLYGFIDINGNYIIKPHYKEANFFQDGYVIVQNEQNEYGVIDKEENLTIPFGKFDYIEDFREGVALVKTMDKKTNIEEYGFIYPNGKDAINKKFQKATSFLGGIASVCINNQYGFINKQGEVTLYPNFTNVVDFYKELALVSIEHEQKYADGTKYIQTEHAYMNKDGYYMVFQQPTFGATMNNSIYLWH